MSVELSHLYVAWHLDQAALLLGSVSESSLFPTEYDLFLSYAFFEAVSHLAAGDSLNEESTNFRCTIECEV